MLFITTWGFSQRKLSSSAAMSKNILSNSEAILLTDVALLDNTLIALKSSIPFNNRSSSYESTFNYVLYDFWEEHQHPATSHLPIISSAPWQLLSILGLYLLTIKVVLPLYMKNRKPYECRNLMLYYNLVNVVGNFIGFLIGLVGTNFSIDAWGCKETPFSPIILYCGYGYLLLKFFDFLDTIFFVLRKKYNQVTFLHVTHHCLMPITCYVGMKFVPYGNTSWTAIINSFVHVVMYFYYFLSALGPKYTKYLWWKKYITLVQLFQFAICACHALQPYYIPGCQYPKAVANFEFAESLYFLFFFSNFYLTTYLVKTSENKKIK